jgi:hypothetical protein
MSSGYGKNGDSQNGVDIFDHFSPATMQCKRVEKFNLTHLQKELRALKGYHAPLSAHFIVTSLEETNQQVSKFVTQHNSALEDDAHPGQVLPRLPAVRLPKLYLLNWPEIKAILCTDLFLAWKWSFHLAHPQYHNLNGVDLKTVVGAASTLGCSLPPCEAENLAESWMRSMFLLNRWMTSLLRRWAKQRKLLPQQFMECGSFSNSWVKRGTWREGSDPH